MGGLVAGMVTIGGITRLTRSGLSMTDWKLQASLPPVTQKEWEVEFERYKQYPEWQQRKSMTLQEFKYIYFWEYGHRMLGRFVGVAFAVPALYFGVRGMIPKYLYPRMALLFGLGGGQGLIGWWMVKSGLNVDPAQPKEIRVSPYRLATHLSMAFTTYVLLMWTAMDVLRGPQSMAETAKTLSVEGLKYAKKLRGLGKMSALFAATTVLSGAYVAGNDAGKNSL
jgi:cytochrome c oxidase assembly protein subunit 15